MSNARWAMPWYTDAKPMSAQAKMATWNMPAPANPAGHTSATCESGTKTSWNMVSWLCVARMPKVSHVSTTTRPGASWSTNPWTICGPAGSSVLIAWNPPSVHTGVSDPKILWPLIFQPPSTRSAVLEDSSSGRSLPASPCRAARTSPRDCSVEQEVAGMIAGVAQVRRHAGPIHVHVHPECGGGGVVGEPALQLDVLVEAEPAAAHVAGDGGEQVARVAQRLEVFAEERVLSVVDRGPLVELGEHLVGEQARDVVVNGGHGSSPLSRVW